MKKTYTKPYIAVETFQLDAAIANSCTSQGKQSLGYAIDDCDLDLELPGYKFIGTQCDYDVRVEGDGHDELCYHGPIVDANSLFMNS